MQDEPLIQSSQKTEYPPNNNANQNIEIYKSRIASQNYNSNYIPQYNINLVSSDHFNNNQYYNNNITFINNNMQYCGQNIENFTSPHSLKNNSINNINNIDTKDNNANNNKSNIKENKEDEVEDPDEINFKNQNDKNKEDSKENEDGELSSVSEEKNSDNEQEYNDNLLAQYTRVKRIKHKWKVNLKGCVVQQDNKETICGIINGELNREW